MPLNETHIENFPEYSKSKIYTAVNEKMHHPASYGGCMSNEGFFKAFVCFPRSMN